MGLHSKVMIQARSFVMVGVLEVRGVEGGSLVLRERVAGQQPRPHSFTGQTRRVYWVLYPSVPSGFVLSSSVNCAISEPQDSTCHPLGAQLHPLQFLSTQYDCISLPPVSKGSAASCAQEKEAWKRVDSVKRKEVIFPRGLSMRGYVAYSSWGVETAQVMPLVVYLFCESYAVTQLDGGYPQVTAIVAVSTATPVAGQVPLYMHGLVQVPVWSGPQVCIYRQYQEMMAPFTSKELVHVKTQWLVFLEMASPIVEGLTDWAFAKESGDLKESQPDQSNIGGSKKVRRRIDRSVRRRQFRFDQSIPFQGLMLFIQLQLYNI
ncbi:hypothetical protein FGO68_gene3881 [Halteria grandinella]|uniref:Uncharacterized protein n=1 Tax=Halteria grandinella TaxID=5974 RepID=A0A8J8NDW3_HALGN|nr:hypothetical protein FGO68_gene3881 [Halteria grandinella]